MVSTAVLAVGIVAVIGGYTNLARNQRIVFENERMQRLALDKYEELVATEAVQAQSLNGDFADRGDDRYLWSASVTPTSTTNLSTLTVTVTPRNDSTSPGSVLNGIIYQQPQTITGSSTGGGTP